MTKQEFETIAKRTVTNEQYKAIETLYMNSNLDKYEFVRSIKSMLKAIPEEPKQNRVMTMAIHNSYGDIKTPNGCYYMTKLVELVDVNIKTGMVTVKVIPNSFEFRTSFDFTDWRTGLNIIG